MSLRKKWNDDDKRARKFNIAEEEKISYRYQVLQSIYIHTYIDVTSHSKFL